MSNRQVKNDRRRRVRRHASDAIGSKNLTRSNWGDGVHAIRKAYKGRLTQ